jgi:hypothetical protein
VTAMTAWDLDLDMLAADIAKLLSRYECPVDASADDIRPALPAFIDQVVANAKATSAAAWESSGDAARWTAGHDADDDAPTLQTGRAPAMTYMPWHPNQGVETGATARTEHYWRCPICRTWAGPYANALLAKKPGMDHRFERHDLPRTRRAEAFRAARKASTIRTSFAELDQVASALSVAYDLPVTTVHLVMRHVAGAINRYDRLSELLFGLVHNELAPNEQAALALATDVARRLGRVRIGGDLLPAGGA